MASVTGESVQVIDIRVRELDIYGPASVKLIVVYRCNNDIACVKSYCAGKEGKRDSIC